MTETTISKAFGELTDPRINRRLRHPLVNRSIQGQTTSIQGQTTVFVFMFLAEKFFTKAYRVLCK